jgi:hypothetical protein
MGAGPLRAFVCKIAKLNTESPLQQSVSLSEGKTAKSPRNCGEGSAKMILHDSFQQNLVSPWPAHCLPVRIKGRTAKLLALWRRVDEMTRCDSFQENTALGPVGAAHLAGADHGESRPQWNRLESLQRSLVRAGRSRREDRGPRSLLSSGRATAWQRRVLLREFAKTFFCPPLMHPVPAATTCGSNRSDCLAPYGRGG